MLCLTLRAIGSETHCCTSKSFMAEETQRVTAPDRRQLSAAMNFFLKQTLPRFDVESCAKAILFTLDQFFPAKSLMAYLWHPVHEANQRVFLHLADGVVSRTLQVFPDATAIRSEKARKNSDDLDLIAHRSLQSFRLDPEAHNLLELAGCRGAVEGRFRYYGKPFLWVILGVANPRVLRESAAEEFLLLFSRCCLVSLHGAYIAESDEGRDRSRELNNTNLSLTLQWFHSVLRHLNLGLLDLQTGEKAEAQSALERASTVASLCLAQLLWYMRERTGAASTEATVVRSAEES